MHEINTLKVHVRCKNYINKSSTFELFAMQLQAVMGQLPLQDRREKG